MLLLTMAGGPPSNLNGYPLDGYDVTGIRRLLAYALIQEGKMPGGFRLPRGAHRSTEQIRLHLASVNESFDLRPDTQVDRELQRGLEQIVGSRHPSYRMALLDITNPARPRYGAIRADQGYVPGSIGKLLVMTGLFNELKRLFPTDVRARVDLLRNTRIAADRFAFPNHHRVPVVAGDLKSVIHRPIRVGDLFSLWEWLDHMVSPSSNAAASIVWKQALLMSEFGPAYPPDATGEAEFFQRTPPAELSRRSIGILEEPLIEQNIHTRDLRQRTYYTRTASRLIPGKSSHATPNQLLRWLIKLEQGKLVDRWSSLEMKKMIYFTRRRYRYAASPALAQSAVFFKSGSLYRCRSEPGYQCRQYQGNVENLMHSVAIVESPSSSHPRPVVYLISMMSNVLKVNSAREHLEIASQIEGLMQDLNR